jgi:hypothetical protein
MTTFLDPTAERTLLTRARVVRPVSLAGKVVGLLDIGKARGDVFLERLAALLSSSGTTVKRFAKPTFAKPAPLDLRQRIAAECDAAIEALAD